MPDVGRFFNIDPLAEKYSYQSPYNFSENRVIDSRELEGLESIEVNDLVQADRLQKGEITPERLLQDQRNQGKGGAIAASFVLPEIAGEVLISEVIIPFESAGFFGRIIKAIKSVFTESSEIAPEAESTTESATSIEGPKPRNSPEEKGIPESSKIDATDTEGKTTKYTEYDKNGNYTKQVEGDRGAPRHGVDGATKKVPTTNTNPNTGETFPGKPKIEPASPQETPPGNNVR